MAVRPGIIGGPVSIRLLVTNDVVTEELLVAEHVLGADAGDLVFQLDLAPVHANGEAHVLRHGDVNNSAY